jgi:hypothetical protein
LLRADRNDAKILEPMLTVRGLACGFPLAAMIFPPPIHGCPSQRRQKRQAGQGIDPRMIQPERQDGDQNNKDDKQGTDHASGGWQDLPSEEKEIKR